MQTHPVHPARELKTFLLAFAARCRAARLWSALFNVRVCQDIVADELTLLRHAGAEAHRSETCDREAVAIIEGVIGDAHLSASGAADLRRAERLVRRSAETTHDLGELVAVE